VLQLGCSFVPKYVYTRETDKFICGIGYLSLKFIIVIFLGTKVVFVLNIFSRHI